MTIEDLISLYSKICVDCKDELVNADDDSFYRGYLNAQINTYLFVINDLKELKGNKHD